VGAVENGEEKDPASAARRIFLLFYFVLIKGRLSPWQQKRDSSQWKGGEDQIFE